MGFTFSRPNEPHPATALVDNDIFDIRKRLVELTDQEAETVLGRIDFTGLLPSLSLAAKPEVAGHSDVWRVQLDTKKHRGTVGWSHQDHTIRPDLNFRSPSKRSELSN